MPRENIEPATGPEPGTPEYEAVKTDINASGEDLYVGTKEEVEKAREVVESEGRAEDLRSYIQMHKPVEPAIPQSFLEKLAEGNIRGISQAARYFLETCKPGDAVIEVLNDRTFTITYKDSAGQMAHLLIDTEKIGNGSQWLTRQGLEQEMVKLGFNVRIMDGFLPGVRSYFAFDNVYLKEKLRLRSAQVREGFDL